MLITGAVAVAVAVTAAGALPAAAGPGGPAPSTAVSLPAQVGPAAAVTGGRLVRLVALAHQQVSARIPYLYGGGHGARPAPLGSRVDCSGLVRELYFGAFGVDIGGGSGDSSIRLSGEFARTAHPVPGDVALFGSGGVGPASHAAIFIGTIAGRLTMIGAPTTGELIKYQYPSSSYWAQSFMGYWHFRGASAADSAAVPRPPAHRVRGHADAITGAVGSIAVTGWALDDIAPATSSTVQLVVDGRSLGRIAATGARPDVNRVLRVAGNHGFHARFAIPAGAHRVCLIGMRVSLASRSVVLGCATATAAAPTGRGSARVTPARGRITVSGWAVDRVAPAARVRLRVTDGPRLVAAPMTTRMNAVVNRVLHITGAHGFSVPVAMRPGLHRICTTALPAVAGSAGTPLGCVTVRVQS